MPLLLPVAHPIVIAHRGASGYLPEHTLPAKAYAHALGADYLEQDVVLTRDDVPIVLHDIHLDSVSDVAQKFPSRQREDGRFYAIDFTWEEVQTLIASERVNRKNGQAVYSSRFPLGFSSFRIPSLQQELELIWGMNQSTGRKAGIYTEIKQPAFHRKHDKDISRVVIQAIEKSPWGRAPELIFLQCFDPLETRRMREEIGCSWRLILLLDRDPWVDLVQPGQLDPLTRALGQVQEYANGIGPSLGHLLVGREPDGFVRTSPLVEAAHQQQLLVHPWTIRRDEIPQEVTSVTQLHEMLMTILGVDGVFSDFPDQTLEFIRNNPRSTH